jgi:hypothetical protein
VHVILHATKLHISFCTNDGFIFASTFGINILHLVVYFLRSHENCVGISFPIVVWGSGPDAASAFQPLPAFRGFLFSLTSEGHLFSAKVVISISGLALYRHGSEMRLAPS